MAEDRRHERWLQQAARGDQAAFAELHSALSGPLRGVALRLTSTREEAEELLQDTFLEVWQRAHDFDPGRGSVRSWILVRLRSRALDRRAATGRRSRLESVAANEGPLWTGAPTAEEQLNLQREAQQLRSELSRLPPAQESAVRLAYWEDLSAPQSAALMKVPVGTVKTRLRLAIVKLADQMRRR